MFWHSILSTDAFNRSVYVRRSGERINAAEWHSMQDSSMQSILALRSTYGKSRHMNHDQIWIIVANCGIHLFAIEEQSGMWKLEMKMNRLNWIGLLLLLLKITIIIIIVKY